MVNISQHIVFAFFFKDSLLNETYIVAENIPFRTVLKGNFDLMIEREISSSCSEGNLMPFLKLCKMSRTIRMI